MTTLADIFFTKRSKYCDKWEQYLAVYERELGRFVKKDEPLALLEIGAQNGGSLELWSQYLPPGTTVIGLDINSKVASLTFDSPHIRAYAVDATRADGIDAYLGNQGFDVIIDDGSHKSADIISSFEILYVRLRPGGIYVIEDLHCSYVPEFQGGYLREQSSIEWLKELADTINCDHINPSEISSETLFSHRLLARSLASVTFYDSVCVIEKLKAEKSRPYRRIISGERGEVEPIVETLIDTQPRYVFDTVLFGRNTVRQANARLLAALDTKNAAALTLQERLTWVQREAHERIEALTQQVERGSKALITQIEEVKSLEERLAWVRGDASERIDGLTIQVERGAQALAARIEEVRTLEERLAWVRREAGERIEALTNQAELGGQALSAASAELAEQRAFLEQLRRSEAEHRDRESSLETLRKENEKLRAEKEELRLALKRSCAWHS